jgi:hypothetical protein
MNQELKVSFYLKKNEMKGDGACPVMARLTVGKGETTFGTKMSASASWWASGRATGKSRTATAINKQLDEIRATALSYYQELYAVKTSVSAEMVKNLLHRMASEQETLLAYFRKCNENFEKRVGINRKRGSAQTYRCLTPEKVDSQKSKKSIYTRRKGVFILTKSSGYITSLDIARIAYPAFYL